MERRFRRLCYEDRQRIEAMSAEGIRVVDIAAALGFHRGTIYNELKRGGIPYRADVAQKQIR